MLETVAFAPARFSACSLSSAWGPEIIPDAPSSPISASGIAIRPAKPAWSRRICFNVRVLRGLATLHLSTIFWTNFPIRTWWLSRLGLRWFRSVCVKWLFLSSGELHNLEESHTMQDIVNACVVPGVFSTFWPKIKPVPISWGEISRHSHSFFAPWQSELVAIRGVTWMFFFLSLPTFLFLLAISLAAEVSISAPPTRSTAYTHTSADELFIGNLTASMIRITQIHTLCLNIKSFTTNSLTKGIDST